MTKIWGWFKAELPSPPSSLRVAGFLCIAAFAGAICPTAQAGPLVSTDSPIGFFTNVAARLLKSEAHLDLSRIQLYPTNQYTPAVHRLLQVTANLYDAITNRTVADYPFLPSVFRPLFTNDGGVIYISGYAEETGLGTLDAPMRDLRSAADRAALAATDMVSGVPLVIGARKGYPNFNKFVMHTQVQVTRKLQFHRPGDLIYAPVNEIDQMFVVAITNGFGVEAWNSYTTSFPRALRMVVAPDLTVALTNVETGALLNPDSWRFAPGPTETNIAAGSWPGYNPVNEGVSFALPLASAAGVPYTNQIALPASAYRAFSDSFVPVSNSFERTPGNTNFYIPHWELTVRAHLRVALIDTTPGVNRIVDYVNLDSSESSLDVMSAIRSDGQCGEQYVPNGNRGSMWCTNRYGYATDDSAPTFGILNQIEASLGHLSADWNNSINEFPAGMSKDDAVTFFKGQFTPVYLHSSNTFNAPYQPYRRIYCVTTWEANDPLVHYTLSDLRDLLNTNRLQLDSPNIRLADALGNAGFRYQPWRGNPKWHYSSSAFDLRLKDPIVSRSDYWTFPTNLLARPSSLGQVHRGTPWQTLYLKSDCPSFTSWLQWTGDGEFLNNQDGVMWDALLTYPARDWHLAATIASLLSTNGLSGCSSVNQSSVASWHGILDGVTVLTNDVPDDQLPPIGIPILSSLVMASNSPPAATIATALVAARDSRPDHYFHDVGDIVAVPELSIASPWLNLASQNQFEYGITDEAYETLPAQLLLRLRPDSIASISTSGGTVEIQFTGIDGYSYAVQSSSNLLDWMPVSTAWPTNGTFEFIESPALNSAPLFYRSVLQP